MRSYDPKDWYWVVGGDESRVFSSAVGDYIQPDAATYVAFLDDGNSPTRILNEAELGEVLRAANVPPFHRVSPYTIVTRLQAAGIAEIAMAALQQDPVAYARFFTAESRGGIDADATDVRAFLAAVGADVDAVLSPDA